MKKIILMCVLAVASFNLKAQSKIGYLNSLRIIALMPETAKVEEEIKSAAKMYDTEFKTMQKELENKAVEFQSNQKKWSKAILESKGKELQNLQERMQKFRQTVSQEIDQKRQTLMQPVLEKAQKSIDKIAKKKGFDYIIDSSKGSLLFANEKHDIYEAVKKDLKLKEPKKKK